MHVCILWHATAKRQCTQHKTMHELAITYVEKTSQYKLSNSVSSNYY